MKVALKTSYIAPALDDRVHEYTGVVHARAKHELI